MSPLFELEIEPVVKGARDGAANLYRQLRAAILDGRLAPGSRLPPTRRAAEHFGVSRNTTIEVYDRLLHERLVFARQGAGTFVAHAVPDLPRRVTREAAGSAADSRINPFWLSSELRGWTGYWHLPGDAVEGRERMVDLRPALVDASLFPYDRLRRSITLKLRQMERRPARSRPPQGNQGNFQLRSAIADHLAVTRSLAAGPDDILVTSGAQQAFDLIARVLIRPGVTVVAVEDPGYPPMLAPFAAAGAIIVPVPVDADGMRVDLIPRNAAIVCVTPSHQFPLGVPLSAERRAELLRLARVTGAVVVEDDYDGEFRHEGSPLTALRAGDADDVVFYVATFSKSMLPSFRLGYLIPPAWALAPMVAAKNALDWHSSSILQLGVATFISEGHLTRHVARMREVYRARRSVVLDVVAERFPSDVRAMPSLYGMHLTLVDREGRDMEEVARLAGAAGVVVHGLARYRVGPGGASGIVVGFGSVAAEELRRALDVIGSILGEP